MGYNNCMAEVLNHTGYFRYNGRVRKRPPRRSELSFSQRPPLAPTEIFSTQANLSVSNSDIGDQGNESQEVVLVATASDIVTPTHPTIPPELKSWLDLAETEPTLLARAADNGNQAAQKAILLLVEMRNNGSI